MYLTVLTNLPDQASAQTIASLLVEKRLAACVNIMPPVVSTYRWQGNVETASEVPLMIKTTIKRYPELEAAIRKAHPYEVPEIIALPIHVGLPDYLQWIDSQTLPEN